MLKKEEKVIIKINNKVIDSENMILSAEEIEKFKRILFKNKMHLCKTCCAKVCLANRNELTGPIFEGIVANNNYLITRCANYRN